jgi:plasmid stability protein
MSKMLRIRNVPDDLHRRLKARSALAGVSMSDYVLRELQKSLTRPTREEVLARMAELPPIELDPPVAEVLRDERRHH